MHVVELSFDALPQDLRVCMQNIPTSFTLAEATVTLLRQVARWLLAQSREFNGMMIQLDASWQRRTVVIDPALQAGVCGPPA